MQTNRYLLPSLILAFVLGLPFPDTAQASPLQKWRVSCGADPGAISKKGNTYTFKTSRNHCPGGNWQQRAEIATDHAKPTITGAYQFSSNISITSPSTQRFDIFQMHDGRNGCAPPLKLEVLPSGHLSFDADYKIGTKPGNNCEKARSMLGQKSAKKIRRDGTEYKLDVIIDFNGQGGFRVWAYLDGAPQINAHYNPPQGRGYFQSEKYYFKHGSYSKKMFPYTMTSRDVRVRRVKLAQ
tara:strand:- start:250 stop:966 length:717 start_codon:yes stop_codon:yes gene_type:complete